MIVKQTFIAFDGKEFETEKECAKYEAANELVNIMPIFKKVKKYAVSKKLVILVCLIILLEIVYSQERYLRIGVFKKDR